MITDHKPLVAIFKKICSDPVTENPAHPPENTSIQGQNTIQARAGNVYCRVAILTQP